MKIQEISREVDWNHLQNGSCTIWHNRSAGTRWSARSRPGRLYLSIEPPYSRRIPAGKKIKQWETKCWAWHYSMGRLLIFGSWAKTSRNSRMRGRGKKGEEEAAAGVGQHSYRWIIKIRLRGNVLNVIDSKLIGRILQWDGRRQRAHRSRYCLWKWVKQTAAETTMNNSIHRHWFNVNKFSYQDSITNIFFDVFNFLNFLPVKQKCHDFIKYWLKTPIITERTKNKTQK